MPVCFADYIVMDAAGYAELFLQSFVFSPVCCSSCCWRNVSPEGQQKGQGHSADDPGNGIPSLNVPASGHDAPNGGDASHDAPDATANGPAHGHDAESGWNRLRG